MPQRRSTTALLIAASVLVCVAGCAGPMGGTQRVAATSPVPALDVQTDQLTPAAPPQFHNHLAARPLPSATVRGQSPSPSQAQQYWNDYQPAGPANGPIAGSNDHLRQPMQPSGAPRPNAAAPPAAMPPAPAPGYGAPPPTYGQSPAYAAPGYATPSYPGQGQAAPAHSGQGQTAPAFTPSYPGNFSGAGAPGFGYPQPGYQTQPGTGGTMYSPAHTTGQPMVGEPLPPGSMIGPSFPADVIPPVSAGMESLPEVPIDVLLQETRTGRFMFGVGINSDAGVTGQIVLDERNFDLFNPPTSWGDIANGTAFRGGGQGFRLEAMPGTIVQRYMASYTDPYMFGFLPYSLNVSAFLFDRLFLDWDEQRVGGRLAVGNRLTPDLSMSVGVRAEQIGIRNPRVAGLSRLDAVVGDNELYSGQLTLTHDTRDIPFAPTEGHLIEFSYEQAFGDFDFPRGEIDLRRYFLMTERPDGSGRHTLAFLFRVGASGAETPIFENYFAGGFSTMRGFSFRGASPVENGVIVGGRFRFLGAIEYMFPLTADDMIKGVLFTDFGTVEQDIEINPENYRIAPGFGLRVNIPALGPAPLAFDFAFPVAHADTDDRQIFSFFFGFGR